MVEYESFTKVRWDHQNVSEDLETIDTGKQSATNSATTSTEDDEAYSSTEDTGSVFSSVVTPVLNVEEVEAEARDDASGNFGNGTSTFSDHEVNESIATKSTYEEIVEPIFSDDSSNISEVYNMFDAPKHRGLRLGRSASGSIKKTKSGSSSVGSGRFSVKLRKRATPPLVPRPSPSGSSTSRNASIAKVLPPLFPRTRSIPSKLKANSIDVAEAEKNDSKASKGPGLIRVQSDSRYLRKSFFIPNPRSESFSVAGQDSFSTKESEDQQANTSSDVHSNAPEEEIRDPITDAPENVEEAMSEGTPDIALNEFQNADGKPMLLSMTHSQNSAISGGEQEAGEPKKVEEAEELKGPKEVEEADKAELQSDHIAAAVFSAEPGVSNVLADEPPPVLTLDSLSVMPVETKQDTVAGSESAMMQGNHKKSEHTTTPEDQPRVAASIMPDQLLETIADPWPNPSGEDKGIPSPYPVIEEKPDAWNQSIHNAFSGALAGAWPSTVPFFGSTSSREGPGNVENLASSGTTTKFNMDPPTAIDHFELGELFAGSEFARAQSEPVLQNKAVKALVTSYSLGFPTTGDIDFDVANTSELGINCSEEETVITAIMKEDDVERPTQVPVKKTSFWKFSKQSKSTKMKANKEYPRGTSNDKLSPNGKRFRIKQLLCPFQSCVKPASMQEEAYRQPQSEQNIEEALPTVSQIESNIESTGSDIHILPEDDNGMTPICQSSSQQLAPSTSTAEVEWNSEVKCEQEHPEEATANGTSEPPSTPEAPVTTGKVQAAESANALSFRSDSEEDTSKGEQTISMVLSHAECEDPKLMGSCIPYMTATKQSLYDAPMKEIEKSFEHARQILGFGKKQVQVPAAIAAAESGNSVCQPNDTAAPTTREQANPFSSMLVEIVDALECSPGAFSEATCPGKNEK